MKTLWKVGLGVSSLAFLYVSPWLPRVYFWPSLVRSCLFDGKSKSYQVEGQFKKRSVHFSIIMPVYNDGKVTLLKTLQHTIAQFQKRPEYSLKLIVVDGGCKDNTLEAVNLVDEKVEIVALNKMTDGTGRGAALIKGAKAAMDAKNVSEGDNNAEHILVFLHCDTFLPVEFNNKLANALSGNSDNFFGCFSFSVDKRGCEEKFSKQLIRVELAANLRSKYLWMPYGDQVFAITEANYNVIGGFKNIKLMEDFDFICRARDYCLEHHKRINVLEEFAECSPRRWQKKGVVKTTITNWVLVFLYVVCGVHPNKLFDLYYG